MNELQPKKKGIKEPLSIVLTNSEYQLLHEYISEMELLSSQEPEYIPTDEQAAAAWEAWNNKCVDLNNRYHDIIKKALLSWVNETDLREYPQETIEILKYYEPRKESDQLKSIPATALINFLIKVYNNGVRKIIPSNRHETITYQENAQGQWMITRQKGKEKFYVKMLDISIFTGHDNDAKILVYMLQQMAFQSYPSDIIIDLDEFTIKCGYSRRYTAFRAIDRFYERQKLVLIGAEREIKGQEEPEKMAKGELFSFLEKDGKYVRLTVNSKFDLYYLGQYYTLFPDYGYKLSNNAFCLTEYIFYRARQNAKTIKNNGVFKISYESIRNHLGLPQISEVEKSRKYRELIINPIEAAIEELEAAIQEETSTGNLSFTITPRGGDDTSTAIDWIRKGYIEIGLRGDYAERFIEISEKQGRKIAAYNKAKITEQGKIAARAESKSR